MLVMPTRAMSAPKTTNRPPQKPNAAVAISMGISWSPIRKPINEARPAASEASSSRVMRWRYGPGWSENMVSSAPAPIPRPMPGCPLAMPMASGRITAAVLRTTTRTGTSGRFVVIRLSTTVARSE